MAFNAGSIEATLTLNRNPFTAGLAAARAQAEKFARENFEVAVTPKLDRVALRAVKEQIEKTAGNVSVTPKLSRTALAGVKSQIERTVGNVQVRTQLDRATLTAVKGQIDRTIGRIQVRAQLDRTTLQAVHDRINRTIGRIQTRVELDRDSLTATRERISNIRATINARLRLDQESVAAVRKRINDTIRPRLNARLALDRDSVMAVRARIAAMRPILRAQLRVDSDGIQQFTRAFSRVRDEVTRTQQTIQRFGNHSNRIFRHMDGTVRAVFMALPVLLPVAASAITGLLGALGGVVSILGVAGAGLAAWGAVAVSVFGRVSDGAALTRAEIARLPPGIREASGALKTLQETWDALVARTQTGVGYAMAAGFDAATAAVRTLDPIINAMSVTLAGIGRDMEQYFSTAHWSTFVSFLESNVGPVFNSLWDIIKNLTRGVMDLVIAFMPLGQWLLDSIASGMQSFAQWASELAGNPEFTNWLGLVRDSLSSVMSFLGSVIVFLFRLSDALAPVGNIILDALTMIFDGLNKLSPEMLAGITTGFAGLFAALLFGATGPVGLAVGAVLGLTAAFISAYEHSAPFREAVDNITASFRDGFLPVSTQVKQAYEKDIKPAFEGMTSTLRDDLMPVLREFGDSFGAEVNPAIATLVEIVTSKLIPSILGFVEVLSPAIAFLVDVISGEVVGTFEVLARAVGGGLQAVSGIFQAFTGLFTGNWQMFWDGLKNVAEGILRGVVGIFGFSLEEFFALMSSWGDSISTTWNNLWSGVGNFFKTIWNEIVTFITVTIPEAWDSLVTGAGEAVGAVGDWFAGLPGMIGYALGYAIGTIIQWGIDAYTAIVNGWNATMAWFEALPGVISQFFTDAGNWLTTRGVEIMVGLAAGILSAWNSTVEWFVNLPTVIGNFFTDSGNWLTTRGVEILMGFLAGVITAYNNVTTWFSELPGKILLFFAGAGAWLWQVGADLLAGLISGLAGAWNTVTTWFNEFTAGMIQGVKDALGIASPSTVFAQIGTDILNGLIAGAQAMLGAVATFFSNLWTGLVDTAVTLWARMEYEWHNLWFTVENRWNQFVSFLTAAWNTFWTFLEVYARNIWARIVFEWNNFWFTVENRWNQFTAFLSVAWNTFWTGIETFVKLLWSRIVFEWNNFWFTVENRWNQFVTFLNVAWNLFWTGLQNYIIGIIARIILEWNNFWANVQTRWEEFKTFLSESWNSFWTGIREFAQDIWNQITTIFSDAMASAQDIINRGADEIGRIWRKIGNLFRDPVNWVIRVVINDGILNGWNTVMGWIGAPSLNVEPLGELPAFAKGGEIKAGRHGVANKDSVPALTMPGEYVLSKRAIANMGGLSVVDQMHQQARMGATTHPHAGRSEGLTAQHLMRAIPNMDDIMSFAYGGVQPHVAAAGDAVVRALGPMPGGIGGVGSRPNASDHPAGLALDFMTLGNVGLGNRVAGFLEQNWGAHAVKYLIWQQRIANSPGAWQGMENRGSPTANHMDHVHASFLGEGGAGGGIGGMIAQIVSWWSILENQVRDLFSGLLNFEDMPGFGSPIGNGITEIPKAAVGHVVEALKNKLMNMFTSIFGGGGGGGDISGITGPVVDQVRQVAHAFGWGDGPEWNAIVDLVQRESSWDPNAANPTTSARGLFQKMTSMHGPVEPTPAGQAQWGLNYIRGRYGSPTGAIGFHNANGYYDEGGWLMPGPNVFNGSTMTNKTHKPEAVLTDEQWTGLLTGLNAITGGQVFPDRGQNEIVIGGIDRLGQVMLEIKELLERRGAAANIIVEDKSGSPVETARAARLALRLS